MLGNREQLFLLLEKSPQQRPELSVLSGSVMSAETDNR